MRVLTWSGVSKQDLEEALHFLAGDPVLPCEVSPRGASCEISQLSKGDTRALPFATWSGQQRALAFREDYRVHPLSWTMECKILQASMKPSEASLDQP